MDKYLKLNDKKRKINQVGGASPQQSNKRRKLSTSSIGSMGFSELNVTLHDDINGIDEFEDDDLFIMDRNNESNSSNSNIKIYSNNDGNINNQNVNDKTIQIKDKNKKQIQCILAFGGDDNSNDIDILQKPKKNESKKNDKKKSIKNNKNKASKSKKKAKKKQKKKKIKKVSMKKKRISLIMIKKCFNSIQGLLKRNNIEKELKDRIEFELDLSSIKISNDKEEYDEDEDLTYNHIQIEDIRALQIDDDEKKELEENDKLEIVKKGQRMLKNMNVLLKTFDFPSKDNVDIIESKEMELSTKEIRKIVRDKYNDCIVLSEDAKYYCLEICAAYIRDGDLKNYNNSKPDCYAQGGSKRYRPQRALKHCRGKLHEEMEERKDRADGKKKGAMNVLLNKMKLSDKEILMNDVITVYIDYRRGTLSSYSYPIRRSVSSIANHYMSLKENEYKPWNPCVADIQYNNPDRHDFIRGKIAADIRSRRVKKPIEKAGGINHLIDGWDKKGEKYNNFVNVSHRMMDRIRNILLHQAHGHRMMKHH